MIMYMYKKICVTNRHLVQGSLCDRLERILNSDILKSDKKPDIVILREKDMSETEYIDLSRKVIDICDKSGTLCILHYFKNVAISIGYRAIHMPLDAFEVMTENEKLNFDVIGVSVHSVNDALNAERKGASYVTAGHVFATDCKKGLEPRGLKFLREVCVAVRIPVYAIGGIEDKNAGLCIEAGASGVCMMSGWMK